MRAGGRGGGVSGLILETTLPLPVLWDRTGEETEVLGRHLSLDGQLQPGAPEVQADTPQLKMALLTAPSLLS